MYDCSDQRLYGAALAVYCRSTHRFLLLTELEDKPKVLKKQGMLGFPTETREPYDDTVRATISRLLVEEIGVRNIGADVYLRLHPADTFAHAIPVYVAWTIVDTEFRANPRDTDVQHAGWYTAAEIKTLMHAEDAVRVETEAILAIVLQAIKAP